MGTHFATAFCHDAPPVERFLAVLFATAPATILLILADTDHNVILSPTTGSNRLSVLKIELSIRAKGPRNTKGGYRPVKADIRLPLKRGTRTMKRGSLAASGDDLPEKNALRQ